MHLRSFRKILLNVQTLSFLVFFHTFLLFPRFFLFPYLISTPPPPDQPLSSLPILFPLSRIFFSFLFTWLSLFRVYFLSLFILSPFSKLFLPPLSTLFPSFGLPSPPRQLRHFSLSNFFYFRPFCLLFSCLFYLLLLVCLLFCFFPLYHFFSPYHLLAFFSIYLFSIIIFSQRFCNYF